MSSAYEKQLEEVRAIILQREAAQQAQQQPPQQQAQQPQTPFVPGGPSVPGATGAKVPPITQTGPSVDSLGGQILKDQFNDDLRTFAQRAKELEQGMSYATDSWTPEQSQSYLDEMLNLPKDINRMIFGYDDSYAAQLYGEAGKKALEQLRAESMYTSQELFGRWEDASKAATEQATNSANLVNINAVEANYNNWQQQEKALTQLKEQLAAEKAKSTAAMARAGIQGSPIYRNGVDISRVTGAPSATSTIPERNISIANLEKLVEEQEQAVSNAKLVYDYSLAELNKVTHRSDFAEVSERGATQNTLDKSAEIAALDAEDKTFWTDADWRYYDSLRAEARWQYMSEEEIDIYNYLLGSNPQVAQIYLNSIESTVNTRAGIVKAAEIDAIDNPVARFAAQAEATLAGGLANFVTGLQPIFTQEAAPTSVASAAAAQMREDNADNGIQKRTDNYKDLINRAAGLNHAITNRGNPEFLAETGAFDMAEAKAELDKVRAEMQRLEANSEEYHRLQGVMADFVARYYNGETNLAYLIQQTGKRLEQIAADGLAYEPLKIFGATTAQILQDVGQAAAQMAPSMIVGAFNPLAGAAVMGASAGGNAYTEKINEGWTQADAKNYALLKGAAEGGLQYITGGISKLGGKYSISSAVSKLYDKVDNVLARVALTMGNKIVAEGGEEMLQAYIEPALVATVQNTDYEAPEFEEVLYNGLIGALMGVAGNVGEITTGGTRSTGASADTANPVESVSPATTDTADAFVAAVNDINASSPQSAPKSAGDIQTPPITTESGMGDSGVLNSESETTTEERTPGKSKVRPRPRTETEGEYELETDAEALANEYLARAEVEREAGFIEAAEEHERKAAELLATAEKVETPPTAPKSAADIVAEAATGQQTAPARQNNAPAGVNSAPQSNLGGGTRTSQSAETVAQSDITSESRKAELEPYVQNGRFDYVPDTNKRQTRRAERDIAAMGWNEAAAAFTRDVAAGKSGKNLVARGAVLLNNISNSDASGREYMDLVDSYIELMHRAGESLQAGKIIQQLTPEGRLYLITRTTNKINDSLTAGQREKAAKQQGVSVDSVRIELDPKLIEQYAKAESDAERDSIIEQMQADIAGKLPASFAEKLNAWRYTAMLGNFKTQGRNLAGNAISVTAKLLKDRLAAIGESVAQLINPEFERTKSVAYSSKLAKQAWNDFAANKNAILSNEKYTSTAQQFEKGIQDKRKILPAPLEWWRKATQVGMQLGDEVFGRIAYTDALAGYLNAHGTDMETASQELLDRARAFAAKEAREAVFRDNNAVSDFVTSLGSGWRHSKNPIAKGASIVAEGVVPFRKTPANVLLRAEEYSPLGIVNSLWTAGKAAKGEATVNDVINSVAKSATGSALTAAGYFLAMAGKLRGVEDDEELDKAQKANGAMDWSWVTDDGEYIALNQFAPMTVPLFMGVRLAELTQGQDLEPKDIAEILKGTTAPMLEMSMLSGLDNAFSDLSKYGDDSSAFGQFLQNALLSYAQQYIPAILGQAEQFGEQYRQTAYTDSQNQWMDTDTQYALSRASGKLPGYDYQQTDYVDMWGRKTNTGDTADRFINAFLNPTYTSQSKATELDAALEELHRELEDTDGADSVYPSFSSRSTKLGPNGETMSPEQYERYQIESGTRARELAEDFYNSTEWERLNSDQKAKVLDNLYSLADSQAKKAIKAEMGATGKALKTDWDTAAEMKDPVEYLAEKVALSDAIDSRDYRAIDTLVSDWSKLNKDTQEAISSSTAVIDDLINAAAANVDSKAYYKAEDKLDALEKKYGTDAGAVKLEAYTTAGLKPEEEAYMVNTYASESVRKAYNAYAEMGWDTDAVYDFFTSTDLPNEKGKPSGTLSQAEVYSAISPWNIPEQDKAKFWEMLGLGSTTYYEYKPKKKK